MMAAVLPSCRYGRYLYLHLGRLGHIFMMCVFVFFAAAAEGVNRVLCSRPISELLALSLKKKGQELQHGPRGRRWSCVVDIVVSGGR